MKGITESLKAAAPLPRQTEPVVTKPGRAMGKSRNPEYEKLTVYVRKNTGKAVRVQLAQADEPQELSELVEELLNGWALNRLAVHSSRHS